MKAVTFGTIDAETKGEMKTPFVNGDKYSATIINDLLCYMCAKQVKNKTEVSGVVQTFVKWFESHNGRPV